MTDKKTEVLYEVITQNTQGHYSNFHSWFYSMPHREKYSTDHPAYLAAQETWEAAHEACAKVCEDLMTPDYLSISEGAAWDNGALMCADAIRARGQA